MASDYELYLTVGESVPYVQYFVKAIKIFDQIINFGRMSDEERAIAALERHVADLRRDLEVIARAVDELSRRVTQNENLARLRWIREHGDKVAALMFRLKQNPDTNELASIANDAGLIIANMLDDDDLWMWSDIGLRTLTNGEQVAELADPDFNVFPLSTFVAAVGLFAVSASLHIEADGAARPSYAERFERFHTAVSVRTDWIDLETPPVSLPEKIRQLVVVEGVASTKYAVNGQCEINLMLRNRIEKTNTMVAELSIPMQVEQGNTSPILCTWPPNLGLIYEHDFEDQYKPLVLLRQAEDMLDRLKTRGTLKDPPVMRFPNETYHRLAMYAVEPSGLLRRYTCDLWTSLKESPEWISPEGQPIGTGWHSFHSVLACEWNVLYAITEDRSILWYRHDGVYTNSFNWRGPIDISPQRILGYQTENYIAGSDGRVYEIVQNMLGGNGGGPIGRLRITQDLTVSHLSDWQNGSGKLSVRDTLESNFGTYETVFGGGNGVIYGIDSEGRLFWHRHVHGGTTLLGPHQIGTGWNSFARVFSAESGFIFGIYPNGKMLAYRLGNWSSDTPLPPAWSGPMEVKGSNWSGFKHLIPVLDSPDPIVN